MIDLAQQIADGGWVFIVIIGWIITLYLVMVLK